jgi:hypothetical protein
MQGMQRDQVFISYSHKDKKWLEYLQTHLKPHVKKGLIVWDDTRIKPGSKWKDEIAAALARANVAVLLVSPYFLASDFISENELPQLLDAAKNDGLRIVWIAVTASSYQETDIAKYQAVHDPDIPLDRRAKAGLHKELVGICQIIGSYANPSSPRPSELQGPRNKEFELYFSDPSFGDTLRPQASGMAVKNIRTALDWLGYRRAWSKDTEFDAELVEAVREFQTDRGHRNNDGWVGPGTRQLLVDRLATTGFDFTRLIPVAAAERD